MACFHPIDGYRAPGGQISFAKRHGWSDLKVTVPCGQCQGCRLERSRQWAMRIMHEASLYEENRFLTLTYRPEELPTSESLVLEHHQLFMKRLKKRLGRYAKKHPKGGIRFYHCGEYGDETHRPHYHTILFNIEFQDETFLKSTEAGSDLYTSAFLDEVWSHGDCYIGDVTFESAAYCGRYVMKKLTGARRSEYGDRRPEYSTMSRNPGIGSPWLAKFKTDVFPHDFCIINGVKVRVPKAYDNLLIKEDDGCTDTGNWKLDATGYPIYMPGFDRSKMSKIKSQRKRSALKHSDNNTPERRRVREELTLLRIERLKRK